MQMGTRRFGRFNWLGLYTLSSREVQRFLAVWTQTLLAPLTTAALFLLIFTVAVGKSRGDVMGVSFTTFIAPGILMMTVIQNAFANTSSSIMIAKVQGNIVDTLMPPLSPLELVLGYLAGGVVRGIIVSVLLLLGFALTLGLIPAYIGWVIVFMVLGSAFLGAVGVLAGIYSNKFDQMAAITNFIVTPLAFLSGTFYSVQALPPVIRELTHFNPIFYLIDGIRYGMLGVSDTPPVLAFSVALASTVAVTGFAWFLFKTGYRLKA